MPARLEIALKDDLTDAEGDGIRQKAYAYFGIELSRVRTVHVITIDADLSAKQLVTIQREIFTNPVIQFSSFEPLDIPSDWIIWVGLRPGVRDNPGSTAMEAVEDILNLKFDADQAIYTSKRYCIQGEALMPEDLKIIAGELLANDIIQQCKIFSADQWDSTFGIGYIVPKVTLDHVPTVTTIPVDSNQGLEAISSERNLALNPNDIPTIRAYFTDETVRAARAQIGLTDPTDVELEYISQARSDHCNHNTFRGLFRYRDLSSGQTEIVDNLLKYSLKFLQP